MASPLLDNLNPEQLEAVTLPHSSALILAGAGSGKTRVLTTRIAWLLATGQATPLSVLAVTFTNKAAKEMLTRLSALTPISTRGMWVGTFHGLCNRMLRAHYRDAELPQLFQIMDTQDQLALIKRLYKAHNIDDERFPSRQLQSLINAAKEDGLRPNQVEAHDEFTRRQVEHYSLYQQACEREGVVDFAELLLRNYELLTRHDGLREHYRRRFSHILVDEFQDTNVLQYKWLRLLTGPDTAMFAVGDDDQSIYAFRGANVANMQHLERDFGTPDKPVKLIKLEQNYRSHGHILDAANALIKHNQGRLGKNLWTSDARGEPVRAFVAPTDVDEAAFIVEIVKGLVDEGVSPAEIAVLYRSNAQSRVVEHALFNAGMPYRVYGGMRFFERAEVKHALAYLRLVAAASDDGAFLRVVNFPPRGVGARTLESLQERARTTGTSLWQAACSAPAGGKAGASVVAFVNMIESVRTATYGLPLAGDDRARDSRERTAYALRGREGWPGTHREPAGTRERGEQFRARSGACGRRRRSRPADRFSFACRPRSGRDAGGRGTTRVTVDDGTFRQGAGVPHRVCHGPRRGPVPARKQPLRARRAGGGATPRLRCGDSCTAPALPYPRAKPNVARPAPIQHCISIPE